MVLKKYEISKDFRNEGIDRNHNPEFTMLEFYCACGIMKIVDICRGVNSPRCRESRRFEIKWGHEIDLTKRFKRKTFLGLIKEATGFDLKDLDKKEMRNVCIDNKIEIGSNLNEGQMLDKLMSELIEPL